MAETLLAENRVEAEKLIDGWITTLHSPSDHSTARADLRAEQREVDAVKLDAIAINYDKGLIMDSEFAAVMRVLEYAAEAVRKGGLQ